MDLGPYLLLALLEGLVMAAVLALTASGLSLVFGVMRVVNVAHGEFFMLGAVLAWVVTDMVSGPPWLGFLVALAISPLIVGAIAMVADRLVLRRLDYDPEATIVATIGILYLLQQAALSFYGPEARPVAAPFEWRLQLPWFGYSGYKLAVIGAAAVILGGLWALMTRTRLGLVMRATQYDRQTAQAFGIDVDKVYACVFGLGAALAAVAAVLIVPISQAHYLMGGDPLLLSFIVVIIGGLGSLRGTVVAAVLIGVSDGMISVFFSPTLAKIIATLFVALVLVFRPRGLFRTGRVRIDRALALHLGVLGTLLALNWVLPAYHHANLARVMALAVYATGYNIAFGYTGLLSLGHALFFAAGMYATGLGAELGGWTGTPALFAGIAAGGAMAAVVGLLALRTTGTAFMIVTLMFAQAGYLAILYFGEYTRGDEGFVVPDAARRLGALDLVDETTRYLVAWAALSIAVLGTLALARSATGRVLVATRENAERSRMLGYDPFRCRLLALSLSGLLSGGAGGLYALLFGYVGGGFAGIQYSILPLLWVLLGGAGTVLGPFLGVLVMFYLIDLASGVTSATLMVVGGALLALVLFAPRGLLGTLRERVWPWLP